MIFYLLSYCLLTHWELDYSGFEKPSAIQQRGIVPFCEGLDMIQQAQSGTGKTSTFCFGILQQLDHDVVECQALVLALLMSLGNILRTLCVHLVTTLVWRCTLVLVEPVSVRTRWFSQVGSMLLALAGVCLTCCEEIPVVPIIVRCLCCMRLKKCFHEVSGIRYFNSASIYTYCIYVYICVCILCSIF